MAFIRRVRTASGATAVQIVEYAAGKQRVRKHVGSAHTEAELGVLLERARELLEAGQGVLDLDVELAPPVARLVTRRGDAVLIETGQGEPSARREGRDGSWPPTRGCCARRWPACTPTSASVRRWTMRCSATW